MYPAYVNTCSSTRAATFTKFGKRLHQFFYTELPDRIFYIMQIGKMADIFPKKNSLKNVPCANI